jgi:hypothetical protein
LKFKVLLNNKKKKEKRKKKKEKRKKKKEKRKNERLIYRKNVRMEQKALSAILQKQNSLEN